MEENDHKKIVRVLCGKIVVCKEPGIQWLIGSPFFSPFTVISTFKCLHTQSGLPFSPDYEEEANELRSLLPKGFGIIGALVAGNNNEDNAFQAEEASQRMINLLSDTEGNAGVLCATADLRVGNTKFFASTAGKSRILEELDTIIYEDTPEKYVWETGCLLRCQLTFKLPVYVPVKKSSDLPKIFSASVDSAIAKLRDPIVLYMVSSSDKDKSIFLHSVELDFQTKLDDFKPVKKIASEYDAKNVLCSNLCSKVMPLSSVASEKNADAIKITVFSNQSKSSEMAVPIVEYLPASEPAKVTAIGFNLDVLCYASKDLPLVSAISKLVVPGLESQLTTMRRVMTPTLSTLKVPQLSPFHFHPPGLLHPITTIYELSYGELEIDQVKLRTALHLRLDFPLDRPIFRIANALNFGTEKGSESISTRNFSILRDVHSAIPSSGVSGGIVSLVEGSYEYYHYLQDGFDDSGWGCAYRSLQTTISWFKLQQYTSIEVPSHREIQQTLVDIGDKEAAFIGSREWIGAIELSFVLDKLLGVSCKIMNVRSGAELPEKCRELSLHFKTQGTPIMIGGGVLAYTLLGVDYNEVTGDCAFLILDPHYTGNDDLKKIVNGGWCGWKKAVDSKGKNFFLHDKFYNLLLPQRPNMV